MKIIKLTYRNSDGSKRYLYVDADFIAYVEDSEIHFKNGDHLLPAEETSEQIVKMWKE